MSAYYIIEGIKRINYYENKESDEKYFINIKDIIIEKLNIFQNLIFIQKI